MRKLILLFLLPLACISTAHAQSPINNTGKISGSISDEKNQPLPSATVLLLKAQDSTLIKSSISNDKGSFIFDRLADNQYLISVSYAGYQKQFTSKFSVSTETQSVVLPAISLVPTSESLKTVTVTTQKPLIEMQADKLVMNVQNTITATGNTALEVLQKAPGVSLDQNENINLNGKSDILIYMDGKQTYLSQSDLLNLLKNMRSDQIEKLEIISNPSAKYDAAGKAIINIVTVKNKNFGTNGSVSAGSGVSFAPTVPLSETNGTLAYKKLGAFPRYSTSLNLNNRQGKVNVFGNFSFNNIKSSSNSNVSRTISNSLYDQYSYRVSLVNFINYKAGVDYFLNNKTTIGVLLTGSNGHFVNPTPSITNNYAKTTGGVLQSSLQTSSDIDYKWYNTTFNGNFKHTFGAAGGELSADVDRSFYNNHGKEKGMNTRFFGANGQENASPLNITNDIPNIYDITAAKMDYSVPMVKSKAKLEIGAKSSWVKSDNDFKYSKNGAVDIGRTNHFIYTENINALYSSFSKEFGSKLSLQIGLRFEQTNSDGNSVTLNQRSNQEYSNLFPSLFLKQAINKNNEISYSYSRRINRPAYSKLNPFIYFSDPYNYEIGNEKLKPAYTNSYAINYTIKHSVTTIFGYSSTKNLMAELYENAISDPVSFEKIKASTAGTNIDPAKIIFLTTDNLAKSTVMNLGVTFPVKFTSWWTANNNFTVLYVKYEGPVSNSVLDNEVTPYNFYTSQVFKLPKTLSLEASMNYNSKNTYAQINAKSQYAVNFGVRKSFWEKKADLSMSLNDIFATNRFYGAVNNTGVNYISANKASRSASVNFTYRFGNSNVKSARNRSTATEDERNRAN